MNLEVARPSAAERAVEDGLLTVAEACDFLRTCRSALYRLMASGDLPSALIGRSRRIPRRALLRFAADRVRSNL